ncbi:C-Jun-amino-terminal kinase-interacting protein 4-like isoform X5 [Babylonia areolata]|uniref:C-Jun-amino-terminal kinase-interacting protein 4-like isoform X5 n=1 Tax=Babylonia areolata TaxID=304850 RepID=UPI003FD175CF
MAETVYGTHIGGEETHVMSEKVQTLAATVYKEFEKVITRYDEDVVKELMPLVVGILESLDGAYVEKQELDVEIELLREDNEQLLTQYEREKQLRKAAEQKYLEMEDAVEGEKKELQDKLESLESIVRMLELKSKNAADHVSRLEEKEGEMKKEYSKLHERYTELFKTHMDYMERTKILMGTDKIAELSGTPRMKSGFNMPALRPVSMGPGVVFHPLEGNRHEGFDLASPQSAHGSNVSLKSELSDLESPEKHAKETAGTSDKEQLTDSIDVLEKSTGTKVPAAPTVPSPHPPPATHSEGSGKTAQTPPSVVKTVTENRTVAGPGMAIPVPSVDQNQTQAEQALGSSEAVVMRRQSKPPRPALNTIPDEDGFEEDELPGLSEPLPCVAAVTTPPDLDECHDMLGSHSSASKRKSVRNDNSIFDELSVQGTDMIAEVDFGADITGREVNPAEYASSDSDENEEEEEVDKENDADSVSDNFFGMGKELENLILENTELLATKNALNIVKDDLIAKVDELTSEQEILREEMSSLQAVKSRLQQRITQLEEELKKTKEDIEKKNQVAREEDEEDVPMAQRKRFTRVEMARVLMERNQYKERLMELQEAVRWTEMIRASREHPAELNAGKKKSSVWNLGSTVQNAFNNLFSSSSNKPKRPMPVATVKYNAPTVQAQSGAAAGTGDSSKKGKEKATPKESATQKTKAYDFLQDDVTSEKVKKEREKERREQYKQVRAHVKKDDGRLQAYGWSLPAKFAPLPREPSARSHVSVPVPVYCRPLFEDEVGVKIWCAAGVNLTGYKPKNGGAIVLASGATDQQQQDSGNKDEGNKADKGNKECGGKAGETVAEECLSSLVWICTSQHNASRINVVNANNPGDVLDTFRVSSSHILCVASVPGVLESDYPVTEEVLKASEAPELPKETTVSTGTPTRGSSGETTSAGGITFVQRVTEPSSPSPVTSPIGSPRSSAELGGEEVPAVSLNTEEPPKESEDSVEDQEGEAPQRDEASQGDDLSEEGEAEVEAVAKAYLTTGTPASVPTTPTKGRPHSATGAGGDRSQEGSSPLPEEGEQVLAGEGEEEKMSSTLPTMWMGGQSGSLYVHSAVTQWRRCLHSVKLKDSILGIVHVKGRVFVALADGTLAIFHRGADGQWDLLNYHVLDLGRPKSSIRCMTVVANSRVWCGYKNKVHIIRPQDMVIEKQFDAHPRKESQVRQLCWVGDGVWVSIRLDSTLRLYHAHTHQHLQDVDIEPYVSKMLGTGKLGFSFVRITAMVISCNRLWIGTGNGVIISVPLSESNKQSVMGAGSGPGSTTKGGGGRPGGVVRVYSQPQQKDSGGATSGTFTPYCSMAQAQLSFHGHKDAVKFFVAVPGVAGKKSPRSSRRDLKSTLRLPSRSSDRRPRSRSGQRITMIGRRLSRRGASPVSAEDPAAPSTSSPSPSPSPDPGRLVARAAPASNCKLVLSGGEGYVDFRMGNESLHREDEEQPSETGPVEEAKAESTSKLDRSHLIVWQVTTTA